MRTLLIAVAIMAGLCGCKEAPPPPPVPFSCGRICNSNVECSGDILGRCRFCNFGTCKSTQPELVLSDAGVDAPADSGSR